MIGVWFAVGSAVGFTVGDFVGVSVGFGFGDAVGHKLGFISLEVVGIVWAFLGNVARFTFRNFEFES